MGFVSFFEVWYVLTYTDDTGKAMYHPSSSNGLDWLLWGIISLFHNCVNWGIDNWAIQLLQECRNQILVYCICRNANCQLRFRMSTHIPWYTSSRPWKGSPCNLIYIAVILGRSWETLGTLEDPDIIHGCCCCWTIHG